MPKNKAIEEEQIVEAPAPEPAPVEVWAERKGMLPQFFPSGATAVGVSVPLNPQHWKFAAAKAFMGWTDGQIATESEFDEAVRRQEQQTIR